MPFKCGNVVNWFIVFELDPKSKDLKKDFTLGDWLFEADDDADDDYYYDELFMWYSWTI